MSRLDELLDKFDELDKKTFNYNRDYSEFVRQLSELSFLGEIDSEKYYLTLLEQVFVLRDHTTELVTLTDEQRECFYTKGYIDGINKFKIANSLHIFINSDKEYVQVFLQKGILDKLASPKDDYGKLYERFLNTASHTQSFDDAESLSRSEFIISNLDDSDAGKETFKKLLKVLRLSKTNTIDVSNFDLKVYQNVSKYWGNLKHKDRLIDDEYQETAQPEIITIPQEHKFYPVRNDKNITKIVFGPGYDEINYEANGYTKQCESLTEAKSLFYSTIDFVNRSKIQPTVHPTADPQVISSVEKHYLSNKWPIAKTDAEADELTKKLTKYEFAVTKFHDTVILKMEVWEYGIVYIATNVWDARSTN